jgi:hypothetical protein
MAIIPKPTSADAFIKGAPDAAAIPAGKPKRVMKGKQAQFSHTMPPALLDELDAFAAKNNLKRAPAINHAVRQMLAQGLILNLVPIDKEGA